MQTAWTAPLASVAVLSLIPVLRRLRRALEHTALGSAWNWATVVWMAWLLVPLFSLIPTVGPAVVDMLWYLAAVLALTPPIAVLGARRPTSRAWTMFVLVPLIVVFVWPVLPGLWHGGGSAKFILEEPMAAGYCLVLVMGCGNYLGLRYSLPALLWVVGLLLVVLPFCPATAPWTLAPASGRFWGTLCLAGAGWLANRLGSCRREQVEGRPALDRVWADFRDLFGIVWSRRVQERFNDQARRTGLAVRLGFHGLESAADVPDAAPAPQCLSAAEKSLRWLLQKFVDPEWIDARRG